MLQQEQKRREALILASLLFYSGFYKFALLDFGIIFEDKL